MAVGGNWSDFKRGAMSIVAAVIISILVSKINRSGSPSPEAAPKVPALAQDELRSTPPINIGGYWQEAPSYVVLIQQVGNQLQLSEVDPYNNLKSACKGNIVGNSMLVDCTSDKVNWVRYTAGIEPGTRRIDLTAFLQPSGIKHIVITR